MPKTRTRKFDVAEYLRTPEDMAAYLEATLDEAGDEPAPVIRALGNIARAKGMTQVARRSGLGRESLYKALSGQSRPSFDTILKVIAALDLRLHAKAAGRRLAP
jgi:probable addiction module antidote protein